MKVCDDKITKLKERIKSELPVYSREQINRSREVTLECVRSLGPRIQENIRKPLPPPIKGFGDNDVLRRVFHDQTQQAILRSRQLFDKKSKMVNMKPGPLQNKGNYLKNHLETSKRIKPNPKPKSIEKKCSSGKCDLLTKSDVGEVRVISPKNPPILPRNLAQEGFEEPKRDKYQVGVLFILFYAFIKIMLNLN